jgi:hypothetical protein
MAPIRKIPNLQHPLELRLVKERGFSPASKYNTVRAFRPGHFECNCPGMIPQTSEPGAPFKPIRCWA